MLRMNENNGEQKGLWTFSGWTKDPTIQTNYGDDVITKTITYKGTWTFEAKPVTNYKVAYVSAKNATVPTFSCIHYSLYEHLFCNFTFCFIKDYIPF